jgi:O-antigen/teichoic acid export membrane protein
MAGVYSKSIHSGKWVLINTFAQKAISLVTFFILARLLVPEDYGVITLVLLVVGISNQITTFPFGYAIQQRQDDVEPYLDPIWTIDVLRSFAIAAVLAATAVPLGRFFHLSESAIPILRLSGLFLVIPAFANVRQLYFFKQLDFRKVFLRDMISQVVYALTAIGFARFVEASPWALFAGYIALYVTGAIVSYILAPGRPTFSFAFRRLKVLVSYTKWMYSRDFLDLLLQQIDKLVVGRLLEPALLGIYSRAKDLSSMGTAILTSVVSKVGFPAFSIVQDKMDKIREGFLKSVDVLVLGALPFTLVLLFEGGALVHVLLGTPWLPIVVPLKIFAFGNLFLAFVRLTAPVLSALGRPDVNVKINLTQALVSVPLMLIGYRVFGFRGLAIAVVASWVVMLVIAILKTRPVLNIPVRAFHPVIASAGAATAAIALVDVALRVVRGASEPPRLIVLGEAALLGLIYLFVLLGISRRMGKGPYRTLVSIVRELGWPRRSVPPEPPLGTAGDVV